MLVGSFYLARPSYTCSMLANMTGPPLLWPMGLGLTYCCMEKGSASLKIAEELNANGLPYLKSS
jgi:hypothetical protein